MQQNFVTVRGRSYFFRHLARLAFALLLVAMINWCSGINPIRAAVAAEKLPVTKRSPTAPPITDLAFATNGKSVVACSQAGLQVFEWPSLKLRRTIKSKSPNLHAIEFSPTGSRLAVGGGSPSEDGTVEVFSWPDGRAIQSMQDHTDSVMDVAWRNSSEVASASLDHSITLWNVDSGKPQKRFKGHSRGVASVCFLNDQATMVSAGIDHSLRVWNVESGERLRSLSIHTMRIHNIALRPTTTRLPTSIRPSVSTGLPMIASSSDDRTVRFWQPTIGRMVRFVRLKSKPLDIKWRPDGSQIAAACTDGCVYVIDPETAKVSDSFSVSAGRIYALAAHPHDGSFVVGGQDGQIHRIDSNDSSGD